MTKDKENDDHIYRAWREFEAYQVPVTEEGEYRMMRRWNAYKAGWLEALEQPAQEWQGLSDEEIEEIVDCPVDVLYSGDYEIYRAIEQALRERNCNDTK